MDIHRISIGILSIHVSSGYPIPLVSTDAYTHGHTYSHLQEYAIENKINKKKVKINPEKNKGLGCSSVTHSYSHAHAHIHTLEISVFTSENAG